MPLTQTYTSAIGSLGFQGFKTQETSKKIKKPGNPSHFSQKPHPKTKNYLWKPRKPLKTSETLKHSITASQNFDRGPCMDQFSRRLHELLLSVLRARELEHSRTRNEKTDCNTSRTVMQVLVDLEVAPLKGNYTRAT